MDAQFKAWPKTKSIQKLLEEKATSPHDELVLFRGKVKLHGENRAIGISSTGDVWTQSRSYSSPITAATPFNLFASAFAAKIQYKGIIIYGEWCGPKIQHGCAVHKIGYNIFAIFAILTDKGYVFDPDSIASWLPEHPNVYILPYYTESLVLNLKDELPLEVAEKVNRLVDVVEQCDPWVKDNFNISGIGEGLVFFPYFARTYDVDLLWKAKGLKHRETRQEKAILTAADLNVTMFVTEERLLKGVNIACSGQFQKVHIRPLLDWVLQDIMIECSTEIEQLAVDYAQLKATICRQTVSWYLRKCNP